MKKVIISIRGGVADIHENDANASIEIIDWDNENQHQMVKSKKENDIVIEVSGGVATCTQKPSDIEVEIIDYDNQATCAFCGHISEEINIIDYDDDICTSCEREQLAKGNLITHEKSSDIDKLINALSQFEYCAKEIQQIWLETDEETHSNLCDDYPFDKDFEEVAENIGKWVFTQQKLLKG
ncbi:hypothetical protein [Bacillus subtilis]|uniref:hypothetical protein n=1 Tax=Bacillus subtilis TaxID=1423 RepID=UPI002DB7CBA4|nr:hypothetical protein [Bacillus subtilis]MEC3664982.1 hypothetical protein [Bacillus subtilis]